MLLLLPMLTTKIREKKRSSNNECNAEQQRYYHSLHHLCSFNAFNFHFHHFIFHFFYWNVDVIFCQYEKSSKKTWWKALRKWERCSKRASNLCESSIKNAIKSQRENETEPERTSVTEVVGQQRYRNQFALWTSERTKRAPVFAHIFHI